jgi:hypothetical protein
MKNIFVWLVFLVIVLVVVELSVYFAVKTNVELSILCSRNGMVYEKVNDIYICTR